MNRTKRILTIPKPVKTVALLLGLFAVGMLFRDAAFGQIVIGLYGIFAFFWRIESATTFKLAIIMLVLTPVVNMLKNPLLAQTFASYAFLLLIIGVVCALAEQYRATKPLRRQPIKGVVKNAKRLDANGQSAKIRTIVSK